MSNPIRIIVRTHKRDSIHKDKIKLCQHLSADALFSTMKIGFGKIDDHRPGNVQHSLGDTLMAGFAMFSLKDPSLLAFDERRIVAPKNLMTIYDMDSIPCDTSMREILDNVDPNNLRPLFKDAFRALQRGKALEPMVLWKIVICSTLMAPVIFLPTPSIPMHAWKRSTKRQGKSPITFRLWVRPLCTLILKK